MTLSTMTQPCKIDIILHLSDKQFAAWAGQCLTQCVTVMVE